MTYEQGSLLGGSMQVEQCQWMNGKWETHSPRGLSSANLVLVFGSARWLRDEAVMAQLRDAYPAAVQVGCTTAGEICDVQVSDDTLVATAVAFEHTRVESTNITLPSSADSESAGEQLLSELCTDSLVHLFVLSDGLHVNGSELVKGLTKRLPDHVSVTGGLSGDGGAFKETLVLSDGGLRSHTVTLVAFYSDRLRVGCASLGGWDPFGPERLITKSTGNVLYELDGKSALELYRQYLGEHAAGLPATGLLFPLTIRTHDEDVPLVRTILSVCDEDQSLTFAGDVPEGCYARLMKANFDRLVEGASGAARCSSEAMAGSDPELAVLISCVGRKMVLKQRIEEEVEAVRDVLGSRPALTGFYSYGEISPFTPQASCKLHNQTMTITTFSEV